MQSETKNRSQPIRKGRNDPSWASLLVVIVCVVVAFVTIIWCGTSFAASQKPWEYQDQPLPPYLEQFRTNSEDINFVKRQRHLLKIRDVVINEGLATKADLEDIYEMKEENNGELVMYEIFISNEPDSAKFVQYSLIQPKILTEGVTYTKPLSLMTETLALYDVYDLRDITTPNDPEYCLEFWIRIRSDWLFARVNRYCTAVKYLLNDWVTSSYSFMTIGTGKAQREGNSQISMFQYIHDNPQHWVLQTWKFGVPDKDPPLMDKSELLISVEYEIPTERIRPSHCLTLKGKTADGKTHSAPIDNSCYAAMKNTDAFMKGDRTYDVLRTIVQDSQYAGQVMNSLTSKDSHIVMTTDEKEQRVMKMSMGGYLYPVKSVTVDSRKTFKETPTACMHFTVTVGKDYVYHHFLYLEHNCDLFAQDLKKVERTTKVKYQK